MMLHRKAYLTIDDSPSAELGALTDFLAERHVPALLFCRGDRLEDGLDRAVDAIGKGFVLGNHSYSHTRASQLGFSAMTNEILRTEALIDEAYRLARGRRPGKYFRFPHMDRGMGGWVVDYDQVPEAHRDTVIRLFADGLNIDLTPPDGAARQLRDDLQDWLARQGFTPPPFDGVTLPWYAETEIGRAVDAMFTFSTADWMITPRHLGKWPYQSIENLTQKIDDDTSLGQQETAHVILAHDQDGLLPVVASLIQHMLDSGFTFMPFIDLGTE